MADIKPSTLESILDETQALIAKVERLGEHSWAAGACTDIKTDLQAVKEKVELHRAAVGALMDAMSKARAAMDRAGAEIPKGIPGISHAFFEVNRATDALFNKIHDRMIWEIERFQRDKLAPPKS